MNPTPMIVNNRPFSVEPFTGIMLPDGIFDTAIFTQEITCFFTNMSNQNLPNVEIYLESVGDPNIIPQAKSFFFQSIPAGASVKVSWSANFKMASPGKKLVSFIAKANNLQLRRSIKQIFVSKTSYDEGSQVFNTEVPQGTLITSLREGISSEKGILGSFIDCLCACCNDKGIDNDGDDPRLWIPTSIEFRIRYNPAYTGKFGDIPFDDPWWKVLGWIVAIVAGIAAIITAAIGKGIASISFSADVPYLSGSQTFDCCTPEPKKWKEASKKAAGILSGIATAAVGVGLADEKDPWRRGQEATDPGPGEVTIEENLTAELNFLDPPNAGVPYPIEVDWTYTRITNVTTYTHQVSEIVRNTHLVEEKIIEAPNSIKAFSEPIIVKARFRAQGNTFFKGSELFVFAIILSPDEDEGFVVELVDDGIGYDDKANDGTFSGGIHLEKEYSRLRKLGIRIDGNWKIYVYAQDVNLAPEGLEPTEAAKIIGGFFVASASSINFNSNTFCPLISDAVVTVST